MEVDTFAQWLLEEGKADKTIESYVTDVKGFQSFLKERTNDQALLSRFSFVRYKDYLIKMITQLQRLTRRLIA